MALGKNQRPKISYEDMLTGVKVSDSWADLCRRLKGTDTYGAVQTIKRYVAYYKIDTSHFAYAYMSRVAGTARDKYSVEEAFVENSPVPNSVAARMFRKFYPPTKCSECGTGTVWNNKPLTLHIDHVNGHGTDWRLENCRYLCPNCHYQTDTHGTKRGLAKRAGEIRATPAELSDAIDQHGCYITVGAMYGLSDRTVKNMVRKYRKYTSPDNVVIGDIHSQ